VPRAGLGVSHQGFPAWWFRRTYYLFQMPRWDRRFRIMLDGPWRFLPPGHHQVDLAVEQDQTGETARRERR
jgi:NADH dehydrogenase